jgi:hypothetical protein
VGNLGLVHWAYTSICRASSAVGELNYNRLCYLDYEPICYPDFERIQTHLLGHGTEFPQLCDHTGLVPDEVHPLVTDQVCSLDYTRPDSVCSLRVRDS